MSRLFWTHACLAMKSSMPLNISGHINTLNLNLNLRSCLAFCDSSRFALLCVP
jgi:hypothetical protein